MPKVSWKRLMETHPAGHLVVGVMPRSGAQDRVEREAARRRVDLMARLSAGLKLKGMFAVKAEEERSGIDILCALEQRADAVRLTEAVGARGVGQYPDWASQRSFLFDNRVCAAIEAALKDRG